MTEERKQLLHPHSVALVKIYNFLCDKGEISFPIQDYHILSIDSIVKTVYANYYGSVRFPTTEDKASAYFCLIIKDHPVLDGNKRLAVLWLEVFCEINNLKINKDIQLDVLAIVVEKEKMELYQLINRIHQILFSN